jgi:putative hydrolase of the HAD superfamily
VERSGLQAFFEAIEIVTEKNSAAYEKAVEQFRIVKASCWMVGNSPRSDINPALEAGLNAVFIPHPDTWELEHTELRSGVGKIVIVQTFRDLRQHF